MTDAWQPPGTNPDQTQPPPPSEGPGIPWEREQNARTLFETLKMVLLEPEKTFSGASTTTGFGPAFIYALILGLAGGIVSAMWNFLTMASARSFLDKIPEEYRPIAEALTQPSIASIIAVPFGVVIGVFLGAAIIHVCLLIVGGANGRFEDTLRAYAFAQGSVALMQIIPGIGSAIGGIWGLVVSIYAIKALHRTTGGKAALAVLLPIIIAILCCCCGAIFAGGAISRMAGQ